MKTHATIGLPRVIGTAVCATALLLAAGCGGGGSTTRTTATTVTTPGTDGSPGNTEVAASTTAAPTTVPPPVTVPAGIQFGTSAEFTVPFESTSTITDAAGTLVVIGRPRGLGVYASGTLQAAISTPDGKTQVVTVDDYKGYKNPNGFHSFRGFNPHAVAHGPAGFVAVGSTNIWDSQANAGAVTRSAAWFSADGLSWKRFDFRTVVGEANLEVDGVSAVGNGFVAVGAMTIGDHYHEATRGVVFTSPDGRTWTKTAELVSRWSVEAHRVLVIGKRIIVTGIEYACTADAGAFTTFSNGAQVRMWASDDGGVTFVTLDPSAGGLIVEPNPAPADASGCPENVVFQSDGLYASGARLISAVGEHLVVWSTDGTKSAISTDGETWTVADVPGVTPFTSEGTSPKAPKATLATFDGKQFILLSDEPRRDPNGAQMEVGSQMLGWASVDGKSWSQLPVARPFVSGTYDSLDSLSDGTVVLLRDRTAVGANMISYERSTTGTLVNWDTCTPAPGANCGFTTLQGSSLANADLIGIDFEGATLDKVDLSGANLTGARFDGATITATLLAKANLASASFFQAHLEDGVDVTDANVSGTSFVGAYLPVSIIHSQALTKADVRNATFGGLGTESFAGASFAGLDLSGATFGSFRGKVDLTHVDFRGAKTAATFFENVDLTGARFQLDASWAPVFGSGVICPDGAPPTDGKYGEKACRL